jgi:protein involved in polysaccharide export with SLBB domain
VKTLLLSLSCILSVALSNIVLSTQQTKQTPTNDEKLITITGAIREPQKAELLRSRISLCELLAMAGGTTEQARGTVELRHNDKSGSQLNTSKDARPETYELTQLIRTCPQSAPFVVPGDQVFLPFHDYIYVDGDVQRPSRYIMDTPVRVTEAIRLAGGVSQNAVNVNIIRCSEPHTGRPARELLISLKDLYRKRSKDIYLGVNDIVFVRGSGRYHLIVTGLISCPFAATTSSDLLVRVWH